MSGRTLSLLVVLVASSCVSRAPLHQIVLDYDETVSRAEAEMLLLNIARARHQRPFHFTTVSGIAATYEFKTNASVAGGIGVFDSALAVSSSESPTINIVPIQGEELTRRLLAPIDESTFGFFYHQSIASDLLLLLMAHGIILEAEGSRSLHLRDADFQRVLHRITAEAQHQRLDVGPLLFEESWNVDRDDAPSARELAEMISQGYDHRPEGLLVRRVIGRQAITNYDPATLTNAERIQLQERAQQYPSYFILMDLRATHEDTAPVRGWIKMRSLAGMLDAIAAGIGGRGDRALDVMESGEPSPDSLFSVLYEGFHYSIPRDAANRNSTAFRVLYHVFQMAVTEVPGAVLPPVTIAK